MSRWKNIKRNPPPVLTEVLLLFSSPMLPKDILVGYLDPEVDFEDLDNTG